MKEIYFVAKGKDTSYYTVEKSFDCIDDAKKYINRMQFYTSENLWIVNIDNYFKNEEPGYPKIDPLVIAYLNDLNNVFKIVISDHPELGEQRFSNMFRFYLPIKENESYEEFISRAKTEAKKKQEEFLKNK